MKMRQSMSQLERAFELEAARERRRREQLRNRAVHRSRTRRITRTESTQRVRFGVLMIALTTTVVIVIWAMFEALAWVTG
jgi:hypothetical protein